MRKILIFWINVVAGFCFRLSKNSRHVRAITVLVSMILVVLAVWMIFFQPAGTPFGAPEKSTDLVSIPSIAFAKSETEKALNKVGYSLLHTVPIKTERKNENQ